MAILDGPLFGDEARGTVNQVLTFKRSAVHPSVGVHVEHVVNWTPAKVAQAVLWKDLCNQWRALSFSDKEWWNSIAPGALTGFNCFMQFKGEYPFSLFDAFHLYGYDHDAAQWVEAAVNASGAFLVNEV